VIKPPQLAVFALLLCSVTVLSADDAVPEPTQRTDAPFRLFRTRNTFNFLKLDTRTGQVWQLQWSDKAAERFTSAINLRSLADGKKSGRFTLYPSSNVFNFVLLDQEDGRQWQIQWGFTPSERLIIEIAQ
jgi:hypothetical protein